MNTITDLDIYALRKSNQVVLRKLLSYPKGITTKDVSKYGWVRFGGTLEQLRRKGYIIKTIPLEEKDNFLYILVGKEEPKERRTAFDSFYHILCKSGHKDVADNLGILLGEAEVSLRNKQRKFD